MRIAVRWCAPSIALLLIVSAIWYWSRPLASIDDVAGNPYVKQFSLLEGGTTTPLSDTITITSSKGVYADIRWTPATDVPQTYEERSVSDPFFWTVSLAVYPRQRAVWSDDITSHVCQQRLHKKTLTKQRLRSGLPIAPVMVGTPRYQQRSLGYQGLIKFPSDKWPVEERRAWTFLTVPDGAPGDYVYELRLYPTACWLSNYRNEAGPPLVLKRGLLRVLPDSAAAESNPV